MGSNLLDIVHHLLLCISDQNEVVALFKVGIIIGVHVAWLIILIDVVQDSSHSYCHEITSNHLVITDHLGGCAHCHQWHHADGSFNVLLFLGITIKQVQFLALLGLKSAEGFDTGIGDTLILKNFLVLFNDFCIKVRQLNKSILGSPKTLNKLL